MKFLEAPIRMTAGFGRFVARTLVKRGALGLIAAHDLALARIADEIQPPGAITVLTTRFSTAR